MRRYLVPQALPPNSVAFWQLLALLHELVDLGLRDGLEKLQVHARLRLSFDRSARPNHFRDSLLEFTSFLHDFHKLFSRWLIVVCAGPLARTLGELLYERGLLRRTALLGVHQGCNDKLAELLGVLVEELAEFGVELTFQTLENSDFLLADIVS